MSWPRRRSRRSMSRDGGVSWWPAASARISSFAGGKGVATAAGIVFALHWPLGVVLMVIWLTMAFGFKISSLAALVTAALMPLGMFYTFGPSPVAWATLVIALLLFGMLDFG